MQVTYLGHSCFEVAIGGRTIIFDPWLVQRPKEVNRLIPPAVTEAGIRHADYVFVSHEHFDHCDPLDVASITRRTMAHLVGPSEALALVEINPRQKMVVEQDDSFSLAGLDVVVTAAKHPQSYSAVGYIVSDGKQSLYFAGDTYEFNEMRGIDVDAALLPVGGTYTMDTFAAVTALKKMRAKNVVPMHYNTFPRIEVDIQDFANRVKRDTHTEPIVLEVGQSVNL